MLSSVIPVGTNQKVVKQFKPEWNQYWPQSCMFIIVTVFKFVLNPLYPVYIM